MVEIYLGSKYAPGFFAWIIPWRDGSAKVGLATREGNPRPLLERFMTRHLQASRKLKGTKQHDASFHPMPLGGPISKTYYPGMLIVGDSAQQVKPTTGGGIVFSLVCGRAAGEIAHEAIRRMLFRLPDRQLERIFSVARSLNVGDVLGRADDIDAQGRILARLALDPRLAISLLYSSVLSLPFIMNSREVSARRPHV
jgi:flavin-dependent dehydrogenase